MGAEKSTTETQQQAKATPEETELNRLSLERTRATQEGLIGVQGAGLDLSQLLLKGQPLPGFLQGLPGGISSEAIGFQAADLAKQNLAGFQGLGIADSGVAFRETAKDIGSNLLFPAQQFNMQNLSQLLNLALGGQAQVQQPILGQQQALGQQLAGLRSFTGQQTTTAMNPFLKSFQQSLGSSLGKLSFGSGGGGGGGGGGGITSGPGGVFTQ